MLKSAGALAGVLLSVLLGTACGTGDVTEPSLGDQTTTLASVTEHCPDGGVKTEVDDAFTSSSKTYSFYVGKVCVKAGNVVYKTTYNGYFGNYCYKVSGLGTYYVYLKETGYPNCKDISYFVIYKKTYTY